MKFAAMIEYIADSAKIEAIRPAHRQYLRDLLSRGQLAISGPCTDGWGAIIVYEAATAEEAETFLRGDPFHQGGVFVRWTIRPWNPVMANPALLPSG